MIIHSDSSETSEAWALDLQNPAAGLRCVAAREAGVLYEVDHRGDRFFIVTNCDGALDFKLVSAPVAAVLSAPTEAPAGRGVWEPVTGFAYDPLRKARGSHGQPRHGPRDSTRRRPSSPHSPSVSRSLTFLS